MSFDVELLDDQSAAVSFVVMTAYGSGAGHPNFLYRAREYRYVASLAKHYGFDLTTEDFDIGIAIRFNDGCEFEYWSENEYDIEPSLVEEKA